MRSGEKNLRQISCECERVFERQIVPIPDCRSTLLTFVFEWQMVTVPDWCSNKSAIGVPTMSLRPRITQFLPEMSMPCSVNLEHAVLAGDVDALLCEFGSRSSCRRCRCPAL